jgi:hypothetical protein
LASERLQVSLRRVAADSQQRTREAGRKDT